MTNQLAIYNGALQLIGERRLASLTENRKPRRELDTAWDGGAVKYCLEQGYWNFAMRTIEADYSPSVQPDFGYSRAFDKPTDWMRTSSFCSDEYFRNPIVSYADEADFWFCDYDTVYIQYLSDSTEYGLNFAAWSETFVQMVQLYLASQVVLSLTQDKSLKQIIDGDLKKTLMNARTKDAMNQPTQQFPAGTWVQARRGNGMNSRWNGRYE
jgi:hypothetical protein